MQNCIFCQIVEKTSPSHLVWEDSAFLAFLSIFPNTKGVTVVIPKQHYSSYIFAVPPEVQSELLAAAQSVSRLLEKAFPDVARVGVVFEGFGVDHLHAKLFPLHETKTSLDWQKRSSDVPKYFDAYEGYISSHDCTRADDAELSVIASQIRASSGLQAA